MGTIPQLSIIKGPTRHFAPNYLHKLFEDIARGPAGRNTALIFNDEENHRQHTYDELDKLSNKIARKIQDNIRKNNLEKNQDGDYIVAVNMHPNDNLIITLLSIWKAGCAYLPLDHAFPGSRIEHIIRESKPAMIIFDEDSDFYLDTFKISFEDLFNDSNIHYSENNLNDHESLLNVKNDLAVVLYTSGSTGVPKGVRLPHKVILNRLYWQFKQFPYSQTEKVCIFKTALTFVDSVCEIWGPLINGLTVLVVPKATTKDPEKLINLLDDYQIERLVLVPSLLRSLLLFLNLQSNQNLLKSLKTWICSGETLTVSLVEEFFNYFHNGCKLCNFYGSTEIMGDVTFYVMNHLDEIKNLEKVPIGLPIDNTMVYLLDKEFRPVKVGDVGELFISGLNLADGYVNGRDAEKFIENPLGIDPTYSKLYRTGDFAKIEKNTIIYEGRTDSQIKIRGHRVDLAEVEKAIMSLEEIEKAVVLCYKAGEINQALLAFVTTRISIGEHQIEILLRDKLTSYMIPQIILVENIPLLVNGKIDRQTLLKMYENTNNNDDPNPMVEISYEGVTQHQLKGAKDLFETVAGVLGRSARNTISINANFYEIGDIRDFISAMDLGEVLERMTQGTKIVKEPPAFTAEMLKPEHKSFVTDMITTSFYQKADLEQWIITEISISDYKELIDALWEPLIEKNLSFITRNENGKICSVALNFDARDEPDVEIKSKLTIIFEFLETLEGPIRDNQLPPGKNKILHSFMMATHSTLTPRENVAIFQFMENEVLNIAKKRGFSGIFTTNTSPLTQQLGKDVYKYHCLLDYQVNKYVASDGTKPFGLAPDEQRAIVHWKPI